MMAGKAGHIWDASQPGFQAKDVYVILPIQSLQSFASGLLGLSGGAVP